MGGIRFEADGTVTIITGTLDYGQGHATPFAQVLCDRLGVPFDAVRLLQGDSDQLIAGGGTGGCKSIMASGAAIVEASAICVEQGPRRGRRGAGSGGGGHRVRARPLLHRRHRPRHRHHGAGRAQTAGPPLDVQHIHEQAPSAYPNGCHVAEVELDPETGVVEVVSYNMVNDFGVLINPMLVEGQAHGGDRAGHRPGAAGATAYDEDGQLVTGSFMDYALPHARACPSFVCSSHPVPARTNVLGAKGCGEAGCAGSLPSVMNAVVDAMGEFGVRHMDMPATFQRVWEAIHPAA